MFSLLLLALFATVRSSLAQAPSEQSCTWIPSLCSEQHPGSPSSRPRKPLYELNVSMDSGVVEVLTVCPNGWNDCDQQEHSASGVFSALLSRNPTLNPATSDLVRQLLVAADPYRSTVPPSDPCLELSAPKTRSALIAHLLEHFGGPAKARYLEVGCDEDATFSRVQALSASAFGVDPASGGTHRMTSDDFFLTSPDSAGPFDLIFVDGLHESFQAERDVRNALSRLAPGGLVLMHDTNPRVEISAAWPRAWDHLAPNAWNGNTYKAAARLRADPNLEVVTADIDHGCTFIVPRTRAPFDFASSAVKLPAELTWQAFEENRASWLGLMAVSDVLQRFKQATSSLR